MDRSTRIGWAALTLVLLSLASAAPQTLNFDNLSGTLPAGTTTLTGTVTITGSVTVPANANVVVAAGTTIRIRDYYQSILVKGGFTANGTATSPVTITSIDDNGVDQWGGLQYQRGSTGSLTQVRFRYGGGYPAAMVCIDSARVSISNCTFNSSGEDGIRVSSITDPTAVTIANCTFARNTSDGIQCDDASPTVRACSFTGDGGALHLTGTSFPLFNGDLTSNGPPIWVDGTTLSRSGTWAYAGIPYVVTGNVTVPVGVALTVAPGGVVKVTDYYTRFFVYGDLSIAGTAAAPVSFTAYQDDLGGDSNRDGTGSSPAPDQWGGLIYFKGATGTLSQVRFSYGGGYTDAMVDIDSARVSLTGCSFFRSGEDGIRVRNVPSPSLVSIVGCSFTRNTDGIECNSASPSVRAATFSGGGNAMRLTGTSYPAFVGDLATDAPGIWIDGATMATSGTWSYAGIPYVLSGNVTVPAGVTLTVAPGVVIKVTSYYDRVFVYGRLDAPGTATAPVTFTSYQDDTAGDTNRDGSDSAPAPDQWGGVIYFRGAAGSLSHARFAYGGGYSQGMVEADSARVSLSNCTFHASSEDGLCVRTVTDPTWVSVANCTFSENNGDAIECNDGSPTVRASAFVGGGNAMRLTGTSYPAFSGDLTTNGPGIRLDSTTLGRSGTWGYAAIPYILNGNVTVPADVTLTVAAGVVIKANSYYNRFFVYGRLDAPGTSTAPVVFTSYQDDTAGDTNRDGSDSAPAPDEWGGVIYFRGAAGDLAYTRFAYGGGYSQGMVEADSARVSLSNCTFHASNEDGLCVRTVTDPSWVSVANCTFSEINGDGIECNDGSPTVRASAFVGGGNAMRLTGTSYPVFSGDLRSNGPGLWVNGTTLSRSGTYGYAGIPYVLGGTLTVPPGVSLYVEPGAIVKGSGYYERIIIQGALTAAGTAAQPVIFTSLIDDVGGDTNRDSTASAPAGDQWGGLVYTIGSTGTLSHAQFRYGGGYTTGLVDIDSARVTIQNARFLASGEEGLRLSSIDGTNCQVSVANSVFERNAGDAIEGRDASPVVSSCSFVDNGEFALQLSGTSFPRFDGRLRTTGEGIALEGIYVHGGTFTYAGIPYVLRGTVNMPAGATVTVQPGVIFKGMGYYERLIISGSLSAVGKPDSAIVFTSYLDDQVYGDTNRDSTASEAAAEQWGGVVITDGGNARFDYCQFANGGGYTAGLVDVYSGASVSLDHCRLYRSGEHGLYVASDSRASIHNSSITSNGRRGVRNDNSSAVVDGTNNWWGDATGPFDDSNADGRQNPAGLGDDVSDWVAYSPWLSAAPSVGTVVVPGAVAGDTSPPQITSGPTVSGLSQTTATIAWTTDEVATVMVEYGPTASYGARLTLPAGRSHSAALTALVPGTTHHYRLVLTDAVGNTSTSSDFTFTTTAVSATGPVVTQATAVPTPTAGASRVTINATVTVDAPAVSGKVVAARRLTEPGADKLGGATGKLARTMALSLANDYLSLEVSESAGYFDLNTADGRNLLYGDGNTTVAKVLIDGTLYRFGESSGQFTQAPAEDAGGVVSVWKVGDIAVTQRVTLVRSAATGRDDAAWIQYSLRNQGTATHQVGLYLEMDTMLGWNDAAPLSTSYGYSANETEFRGTGVPTFWQAFEEGPTQGTGRLVAQGTLVGAGATAPDRFVVGPYDRLVRAEWNYTIGGGPYGDSAVGLWWNAQSLAAGATRAIATFYGLGQGAVSTGVLSLNVTAPAELTLSNGQLSPNPFEIIALVTNSGSASLSGVSATLVLPAGLTLVSGQTLQRAVNPATLAAGQTGQVAWRVQAAAGATAATPSYTVRVSTTTAGVAANELSRSISIPALVRARYVAAAEFYRGTDPGTGRGTAMTAVDGAFDEATEEVTGTLDVTGLAAGTYAVTVRGRDSDGVWGRGRAVSVQVSAAAAPVTITVAPAVSSITQTGATIAWTTDQTATSLVEYGLTTSYGQRATGADGTRHTVNLTGLTAGTVYHYRASSTAGGRTVQSADSTFVTAAGRRLLIRAVQGNRRVKTPLLILAGRTVRFEVGAFSLPDTSDLQLMTNYTWQVPAALGTATALGSLTLTQRAGVQDSIVFTTSLGRQAYLVRTQAGATKSITIEPPGLNTVPGGRQAFRATAKDQYGNVVPGISFSWYCVGGIGTINATTGAFVAGTGSADGYVIVCITGQPLFADVGAAVQASGRVVVAPPLPQAYRLYPNAPNPFNASTQIAFDLPEAAPVRLQIYNAVGQQIAEVVDQTLPAGHHQVTWDATGQPTGLYIVRLAAGLYREQRKMLLVR